MTAEQFVAKVEEHWDKELKDRPRQAYLSKCKRFSGEELDQIFERLLEEYTYLPRISQVYKVAFEGLQIANGAESSKSVCGTCFGSGAIPGKDGFYDRCHCICTLCDGTGWQKAPPDMHRIRSVYGENATADTIQGTVKRCECRSTRRQYQGNEDHNDRVPF